MKTVNVETYDSRIFQAIMPIVVKNQDGVYAVLINDLCEMIRLDVNAVNNFLLENYAVLRKDNIPHLESLKVNPSDKWHYIQGHKAREVSGEDVFVVLSGDTDALSYALLDILRNPSIRAEYEEKFAVVLSMTLNDCLSYAPKFEC